jgi:hypothetical protein
MNATLDPPVDEMETETPANRIKGYYASKRPELPKTDLERHAVLTDCVMASILALKELLYCGDPQVVMGAADRILAVEKTRLRHDRNVSGCKPPLQKIDPSQFDDDLPSVQKQDAKRPTKRSHTMVSGDEEMLLSQLEKNLEMMFGTDNDEEDDVKEAPAPVPTKPAAVYAKTEEEALDWHVVELREGLRKAEKEQPGDVKDVQNDAEARMIVEFHLNGWKMKAIEIPKGGFWRTVAAKMKKPAS